MSILYRNISKWKVGEESLLLVTAVYPGSGKSTLAENLSAQNNAIKIEADWLEQFLRLDKYYPKEAYNMNIIEYEELLNDPFFIYDGKFGVLLCLNFVKKNYPDIYDQLKIHRYGEEYYTVDTNDDSYIDSMWDKWVQYIFNNYRHYNKLIIFEGGQLLRNLIKDENQELLDNIPLVIVDTSKLRAYYQMSKRTVEKKYSDSSSIRKYLELLYELFARLNKKKIWNIYKKNEARMDILRDKLDNNYEIDNSVQPKDWTLNNLAR